MKLNSGLTGTPSNNAGVRVNRGNQTNVKYAEAFTLLKYLDYD